jgi:SAM-dependent MidA family methyltransferase
MRQKEKKIIDKDLINDKIIWYDSIEEIPSFTGCVLANEVLDNFAVHKVIMKQNDLKEIFVDYDNGFIEVLRPAKDDLKEYFTELGIELPNDFYAEVNLEAIEWIKKISSSLERGFVLTIDYGYPSSELYQSYHRLGTIVCYNKHTVNDLPYFDIGKQDITAHVNFSALNLWGNKHGLTSCGFTNQSQFLLGLGLTEQLRKIEKSKMSNNILKEKLFLLHTLLISMGKKIKVLIQQKGMQQPVLSGSGSQSQPA